MSQVLVPAQVKVLAVAEPLFESHQWSYSCCQSCCLFCRSCCFPDKAQLIESVLSFSRQFFLLLALKSHPAGQLGFSGSPTGTWQCPCCAEFPQLLKDASHLSCFTWRLASGHRKRVVQTGSVVRGEPLRETPLLAHAAEELFIGGVRQGHPAVPCC